MAVKYIAYKRVSTKEQGDSRLGLEAQERTIANFIKDGELLNSYTEIESGKKANRPILIQALNECKQTGATLVIAKLDRLSRSVSFISSLMDSKVNFVACDSPFATPLTIHILAAVAQAEREATSARTVAALQSKKERGFKLGNPNLYKPGVAKELGLKASQSREYAKPDPMVIALIKSLREQGRTQFEIQTALRKSGKKVAQSTISKYLRIYGTQNL